MSRKIKSRKVKKTKEPTKIVFELNTDFEKTKIMNKEDFDEEEWANLVKFSKNTPSHDIDGLDDVSNIQYSIFEEFMENATIKYHIE